MSAAPEYVTPDPTPVEASLAFLSCTLADLEVDVPAMLDDCTDDEAVRLLADLRERRLKLAEVESYVETQVSRRLGKGKHKAAGWQVQVHSDGRWTDWRHDDVAWKVCRDIAVDPATGEVVPEVAQIVDEVRSRILNCARPSWRLTPLRDLGLDPSDFATWQCGRASVTLTADEAAE